MGFSFRFPVVVSSGSHPSADIELAHVLSACTGCRCGGCAARAGFLDDAVISLFPSFSPGWLVLRAQSFRILHVRHILFSSRDFSTRGGSVDGRPANAQIQSAKNPPQSTEKSSVNVSAPSFVIQLVAKGLCALSVAECHLYGTRSLRSRCLFLHIP